jgi:hypothetical protein
VIRNFPSAKEAIEHTFSYTINTTYQGCLDGRESKHGNNNLALIRDLTVIHKD